MKYIFLLLIIASVYSCNQAEHKTQNIQTDSTAVVPSINENLLTDTGFGKINKTTTYVDLVTIYGKDNLQDTMSYAPEGLDSFKVTKIYANTPKEIVVEWQKDKLHKVISAIELYQENSPYYTIDSLQVGSTLEKLVQANGKRISFYGTGWDYGGTITSYNNGKFEKSDISFFLNSREDASEKTMGDQELHTDLPKVKPDLKKLYIAKISLTFNNKSR